MWQGIIVILGLIFSFFLGKIAKEEVKQGRKYFLFSEKILLLVIIIIAFFYKLSVLSLIGIVIGLIICRFFKKIYFYFGIIVIGGINNKELFLALISLIFLFSLVYGSLEKFKLRNFFVNLIIFILPFSLLLVESFINSKIGFLIGVGIGGVIEWARGSAW